MLLVRTLARVGERRAQPYLVGPLVGGVFFVLQFLFASSLLDVVAGRPAFVIEFVVLFALWLYAFVRFMTRQRSGPGDDESRERGAASTGSSRHRAAA